MSISCLPGNLRLGKKGVRVDWLSPQLKKKLQLCEEEPSSIWVQGDKSLAVPRPAAAPLSLQNVLECLNMVCWKYGLRTPVFITKCVQLNPNGWQKFWYQVMIPGCHVPVSGFTWVSPDRQGQSKQEKAKAVAALHFLQVLGESLHSQPPAFPTVLKGLLGAWSCGTSGAGWDGALSPLRWVSPVGVIGLEAQDARGGGLGVRAEPDTSLSTAGCQLT